MTYVIAEIGFNHGGSVDLACDMIHSAVESGADAVKFQSFYASDLYFPDHEHYKIFEAGELSEADHVKLRDTARSAGIDFLSTPFSTRWVNFLETLNPAGFKIASMDLNNPVLQKAIARTSRKVYLSTGASEMKEIKLAVKRLQDNGAGEVIVFHCISNYPTALDEAGLWMIPKLKEELGVRVGFSDHTLGATAAVEAVALGAEVVEKHFTTDKNLPGPDHAISSDPAELKELVEAVRNVETVAVAKEPDNVKLRPDSDKKPAMRRGVYAGVNIAKGEMITLDKLALVRPEITPLENLDQITGQPASHDYQQGSVIKIDV